MTSPIYSTQHRFSPLSLSYQSVCHKMPLHHLHHLHLLILVFNFRDILKLFLRITNNRSTVLFVLVIIVVRVVNHSWWFASNERVPLTTKASNEAILQNICSWGYGLLENRICSNEMLDKISLKICSYLFLLYFENFEKALLENLMCSSTFCLSWKIYMCSCTIFGSPRKDGVFL